MAFGVALRRAVATLRLLFLGVGAVLRHNRWMQYIYMCVLNRKLFDEDLNMKPKMREFLRCEIEMWIEKWQKAC